MTRIRNATELLAAAACALAAATLIAQTPTLSPEWITSPARQRLAAVARVAWRRDGRALLYDVRQPAERRVFELLDPQTRLRTRLISEADALASVNRLLDPRDRLTSLTWPESIDEAGRHGLYALAGGLFVLDLESAAWTRVPGTASARSASFSPDGRRIAFVRDNDLYIHDLESHQETRLTRDGSETTLNGTLSWLYWEEVFGRRDVGYWWADDSEALAFFQTDESLVAPSHFVDVSPAPPRLLTQRYPFAGSPNPRVRVGLVELKRPSSIRWIALPEPAAEYIVRVQWLPGSRHLAVEGQTRDQKRLDVFVIDRATLRATRLLTETDPGWVNVTDDLYFLRDGRVVRASERNGHQHLYRFRLNGELVNPITSGPWAVASNAGGVPWLRQSVAAIDEANDWIYFIALRRSSIQRQLYRVHADGSGLGRVSDEDGVHAVRFSPNAQFYFDTFSTSRTLPALTLHRADGTAVETISSPRPELIAGLGMQPPRLITVLARDHFRMPAEVWTPAGFDPTHRYPLILYVYGGASSPTVIDAWPGGLGFYHQLLLREGYVVAYVDNRTATGMSKRLENLTVGRVGEPEAQDLLDAVRWFKSQSYIDASRVGVWGWSGGGTMTLGLMTQSTEFKAGIAVAPVTDWRNYDTRISEMFLGLPRDNPRGYDATSLVLRAKDLHGRLLLVHGTYDDNVHPLNEQAFMNALIEHGTVFELMTYPMRQHDIGDPPAQAHLFKTMIDFWKRSL